MEYSRKAYRLAGFILPALITYAVFCLYPLLVSAYYSLLDWDGFAPPRFVLFDNFIELFHDKILFTTLKNGLVLVLYGVLLKLPLAMFFAVLVNQMKIRGAKFFRLVYFFPCIIATAAVAMMWSLIYNPQFGLLTFLLQRLGLSSRNWLADYSIALHCVYLPTVFIGVGFNFVLYSSGLSMISHELYEAADIDGASFRQKVFLITIPLLRDVIVVSLILEFVGSLKTFDLVWILTGGGPAQTTEQLATFMYRAAFQVGRFGYGSAISLVIFILAFIYTIFLKSITRKEVI